MKILIMGGFLGSGKTSVIRSIAKRAVENEGGRSNSVVIIENEIGEIGIDDKVLSGLGLEISNIFAGCICCSLAGYIVMSLTKIKEEFDPSLVIIESSGVGYPFNIKENIEQVLGLDSTICCVVDAKRWKRLYIPMHSMFQDQLKDSDFLLVNKCDLVDEATSDQVMEGVMEFCPDAVRIKVTANNLIDSKIVDKILER